jgi:hypothetical protein
VAGAEEFLVSAELLPLTSINGSNRICAQDLGKNFSPWFIIMSAMYSPYLVKVYGGVEALGASGNGSTVVGRSASSAVWGRGTTISHRPIGIARL